MYVQHLQKQTSTNQFMNFSTGYSRLGLKKLEVIILKTYKYYKKMLVFKTLPLKPYHYIPVIFYLYDLKIF